MVVPMAVRTVVPMVVLMVVPMVVRTVVLMVVLMVGLMVVPTAVAESCRELSHRSRGP
jgi:hypothetical protein